MNQKYMGATLSSWNKRMQLENVFHKGCAIHPLHLAASYRNPQRMHSLLAAGADPEVRDGLGRSPLHLVVTCWLSAPTSVPQPYSSFQDAVMGVCRRAETCLHLLCQSGANINAVVERQGQQTALHLSVCHTAVKAVDILISYRADVNAVDSGGMTPLHMAAGILNKDIIAILLRHGADINMVVKHTGNTPLHLAVVAMAMKTTKTLDNDLNCVSQLLEHGAEPNAENKAGMTPLQQVCSMGNKELVDLLLKYGANINKLNPAGENCLFMFLNHRCNLRNSSLLMKLLSLTSPLTVYNQKGQLPLTLTLPCFLKQRDQLLTLTKQPGRLQDICKSDIYLKYTRSKREEVKKILPKRLYEFVFNDWENSHNIIFVTDEEQDSFNNTSDISPS